VNGPGHRGAVAAGAVALVILAVAAAVLGLGIGRSGTLFAAGPTPHFVDETAASGLTQTYDGPFEFAVGGGVTVLDCNDDGRPDLYLAGGANAARLFRNDSSTGGSLRFTPVPDPATDLTAVNGAYPIDIDGDGHVDLVVLREGENVILRGLGDCRFERANERFGFDGGTVSTTAFSATWEGAATLPTLAIGRYANLASQDPQHLCYENELIRPVASGTTYGAPIPLTPSFCALSMLFSDWNLSGRRDLRVSNDDHYYLLSEGEEQLWRVAPGEAPRLYTAADGWAKLNLEGMGIASYDVTGDGYPDVFLTTQGPNRLQTLTGGPTKPTFGDIGLKRNANAGRPFTGTDVLLPSTAWHDEFADVNNDGLIDLFIAKGNVTDNPDHANQDPSNLLLGQDDGTFKEVADAAGILSMARGRGAALADFNLDGLLDLVESNYGAPTILWRNVGSGDAAKPALMGNWLALRVSEPGPNVDAIGGWLEVQAGKQILRRELTIGGGHVGGELGWIHFGVGSATDLQVRVQWPDGQVGPWLKATANTFGTIDRGTDAIETWVPPAGP